MLHGAFSPIYGSATLLYRYYPLFRDFEERKDIAQWMLFR